MKNQRLARAILAGALVLLAACSDPPAPSATAAVATAAAPQRGGAATVLLDSSFAGSWPAGLDPATNPNGGANLSLMNAVFGGLFQLVADDDGSHARIEGDLATSYDISDDGRSLIVHLRQGVTFSDGTPFDAAAVKYNIERALASECVCSPAVWPWAKDTPVTMPDEHTVILHFERPYGPVINAIPASNINWIASPTALKTLGETAFRMKPVGAGPFEVVSNTLSSELVLQRNPRYWRKDRPYLDRLVFRSIGGDQAAYQALLAGDAQAYEGMSSPLLTREAESNKLLTVTRQPATSPGVIQLNTTLAPFNDRRAREAIYFATDTAALRKGLFYDQYPISESFTASGGLFHRESIPGYRTHDLAKARAIVQQLGGLHVTLGTLKTMVAEQLVTALQSQWQAAGIDVRIETHDIGTLIGKFQSGNWQAMMQYVGSYDPDVGSGLGFRFNSKSPFSGVKDPMLDELLNSAVATVSLDQRDERYFTIARYLSDNAYAPFLVAQSASQVTRGLHGPGLTTGIPALIVTTSVPWQEAWRSSN